MTDPARRRRRSALAWGLGTGFGIFLCGVLPLLPGPRLLHPVSGFLLLVQAGAVPALLGAALALPVCGIAALFSARPRWAVPGLVFCLALGASVGASILGGAALRRARFADAAELARPLIAAIEAWRARGAYPEGLEDLYRGTMERIPSTGLLAYPEFSYRRAGTDDDFSGYELRVTCPVGPFQSDVFVYRPGASYPELLYGGRVERIADWAYVHGM